MLERQSLFLDAARFRLELSTGLSGPRLLRLQFVAIGRQRFLFTLGLGSQPLDLGLPRTLGFGSRGF